MKYERQIESTIRQLKHSLIPGPDMDEDIFHQLLGEEEPIEDQRVVNEIAHEPSTATEPLLLNLTFWGLPFLESNHSLNWEQKNSRAIRSLEKEVSKNKLRCCCQYRAHLKHWPPLFRRALGIKGRNKTAEIMKGREKGVDTERKRRKQRERGENRKREEASKQTEEERWAQEGNQEKI